jgi:hypothetical protein
MSTRTHYRGARCPGWKDHENLARPTNRRSVFEPARRLAAATPIVHEVSTAGKAIAFMPTEAGWELLMAAPNKMELIAKVPVKPD